MKIRKRMTIEEARKTYQKVAKNNHTTVEEVEKEIRRAMVLGMLDPDPNVRTKWQSFLKENSDPTPEDLLIYLTEQIMKKEIS